jgi:hypothetical protein
MRWLIILAAVALAGCLVLKSSPAPGCMRYLGPTPMGGCFGRNVIADLHVEPVMDCLRVSANNCNGGVLAFENRCGGDLSLEGYTIRPGPHQVYLDFRHDATGGVLANRSGSNFALYRPERDEEFILRGMLGSTGVRITFNKSGPLC